MAAEDLVADGGAVLVCGLGRLGQHCVATLRGFGVALHGIDARPRDVWEVAELPSLLDSLTVGDCRLPETLQRAGIARCRAVLLVTSDERANIAAAFAVRSVAPGVRIVARSSQRNLSALLAAHIHDFIALEPTQLAAPAFALAALGTETAGLFRLGDELVRVSRVAVHPGHRWRGRLVDELDRTSRRVLTRRSAGAEPRWRYHDWEGDARIAAGDVLTCIDIGESEAEPRPAPSPEARRAAAPPARSLAHLWRESTRMTRVATTAAAVLAGLCLTGAALYKLEYPELSARDAANVAVVLILGGFDNLFGQLHLPFAIPLWLHAFSVLLSVSGTVGIGILYAFLTERILSARFQLLLRRPRVPKDDHVILAGTGALADEIARLLESWKRRAAIVTEQPLDADASARAPARVPTVVAPIREALERANVAAARSVVALASDEVTSLETALTARAQSSTCTVVLRSDDARFRQHVAALVPGARALGVHALAAEAFAAAAFGENVHQLVDVDERTMLVTEQAVDAGDPLQGRLVSEIAYGYGVLVVAIDRAKGRGEPRRQFFPSDDLRVGEGDRLVLLGGIDGLRAIEKGRAKRPAYTVDIEAAASPQAAFEGARVMARVSGCEVALAADVMNGVSTIHAVPLYAEQARRLVRELAALGITARVSDGSPAGPDGPG
jgi:Trk K+ transport system NAD-binding subunit